ncbi:MAG: hypothetical protein QXQ18_01420 [Candidatus Aenigmatarchaeota archaeon]
MVERKIRKILEANNWLVVRAGGSLGEADLVCLKNGKCFLFQIKSTRKKNFYYYGYSSKKLAGFPFFIIVDFGYGRIRVVKPKKVIKITDGMALKDFLVKY